MAVLAAGLDHILDAGKKEGRPKDIKWRVDKNSVPKTEILRVLFPYERLESNELDQ